MDSTLLVQTAEPFPRNSPRQTNRVDALGTPRTHDVGVIDVQWRRLVSRHNWGPLAGDFSRFSVEVSKTPTLSIDSKKLTLRNQGVDKEA